MIKEHNSYEYCDPEDENSDTYTYKVVNYGDVLFEFFRDAVNDVPYDVPGKGKFTCNYHY